MTQQDYEKAKAECWEEFKRENLDGEVYVNPADLSCTLVSPEANDIIATSRDSLIDSVIERIKTVPPDIVVIEK